MALCVCNKDTTLEETAETDGPVPCDGPCHAAPRFGGQNPPREANCGNVAPTWPNLQSTDPGTSSFRSEQLWIYDFNWDPKTPQKPIKRSKHTPASKICEWPKRSATDFQSSNTASKKSYV